MMPEQSPYAPQHSYQIPPELQAVINDALAAQRAEFEAQMKAQQDQITLLSSALSGVFVTVTPEHAGGPGTETAATWSQWEQERSYAAKEALHAP